MTALAEKLSQGETAQDRSDGIALCPVEKIPAGQGKCFVVGGNAIAVFRSRGGDVFACQNRCPHKGGPLSDGVIGAGKVICPLHAHKFDLLTGKGSEPGERVETYAVESVEGEIRLMG